MTRQAKDAIDLVGREPAAPKLGGGGLPERPETSPRQFRRALIQSLSGLRAAEPILWRATRKRAEISRCAARRNHIPSSVSLAVANLPTAARRRPTPSDLGLQPAELPRDAFPAIRGARLRQASARQALASPDCHLSFVICIGPCPLLF
jgi:hypothetical protein